MILTDIDELIERKSLDLLSRSERHAWAACAAVWARVFVLAAPGWYKWPEIFHAAQESLAAAMTRCSLPDAMPPGRPLAARLQNFSAEDDGSAGWQYIADVIVMLSSVLNGNDIVICLQTALRAYLEGTMNILENSYAATAGGVIREDAALQQLSEDLEWEQAVEFVKAL